MALLDAFVGGAALTKARMYLQLLCDRPRAAQECAGAPVGSHDLPHRSTLVDRLATQIGYVEGKTGITVDPGRLKSLLGQASEALAKLFGDGEDAQLGPVDVGALEAVVETEGSRPVLFVEDDFVDLKAPSIGDYADRLARLEDSVRAVCGSVGRVDNPFQPSLGYSGTAWMIDEGLVITNYHVLKDIAPLGSRRGNQFVGQLNTDVAVHFGHEVRNELPDRRFPIRRVVGVGRTGDDRYLHPQVDGLNFDGLDLAVLQLEPVRGRRFPPPIPMARGGEVPEGCSTRQSGIYLVGYPGEQRSTTPDLFESLFGGVKGFKRLAPGQIDLAAGEVPNDPRGWVLAHDASTLGGNSGSVLVNLDSDGRTAVGLHFAGVHRQQNWAYALDRITENINTICSPGFGDSDPDVPPR